MPLIFGEQPNEDGWIKVTMVHYKMEDHPDATFVEEGSIPEPPQGGMGVGWVQMFHPETKKFKFDQIKVPYTDVESRLEIANAIRELAQAIKEK